MRVGWHLVSKILLLALVFFSGYGLASAQYIGAIQKFAGGAGSFDFSSSWGAYLQGVLAGLGGALCVIMIINRPRFMRRLFQSSATLPLAKEDSAD